MHNNCTVNRLRNGVCLCLCVWQCDGTNIFCVLVHEFMGCNVCVAEGVSLCGCLWVGVVIWFKCMFAQIHTVYSRLQFQIRVMFIVVKYSVTTANYNTDCMISWQSCNYSAGTYLKLYPLNCLLPGGDFNNFSNTPIYCPVSLICYKVIKH